LDKSESWIGERKGEERAINGEENGKNQKPGSKQPITLGA